MEARSKMCWTGAGLVLLGTGLAVTGAVLLTSAGVAWTTERLKISGPKHLDKTIERLGNAGTTLGAMAGRMQQQAARAARVARMAGEGALKGFNEALTKG